MEILKIPVHIAAIDCHVHPNTQETEKSDGEYVEVAKKYFKTDIPRVSYDDMAAMYRAKNMMCVLLGKDARTNTGLPPIVVERAGVTVTRVGTNLGAEISGVDLRRPLLDEAFKVVEDALVENELIIFRDQSITSENLMDFGRRFGELTVHPFAPRDEKAPVLIKFTNDEDHPPFGTDVWHSDETFRAEPPMATVLCAKEVPAIGGDTVFASMSAAFEGLSDRMQQFISGLGDS